MIGRIRISCGYSISYPYNTPSILLKRRDNPCTLSQLLTMLPFITASYADRHNTLS